MLYYKALKQGTLDLGPGSGAEPVAVEALLGSRTLRQSEMFDPEAVAGAARRARTIRAKATENFEERGLRTLHAQRADAAGDAQIWGLLGCQKEAAFAAERVIVVCEELVDEATIRRDPNRTMIPGLIVDAVVVEPRACHPSYTQGYYDRDNRFYREWDTIARESDKLDAWLREWVFGLQSHAEYVEKLGPERWAELAPGEAWSDPVNYGRYA